MSNLKTRSDSFAFVANDGQTSGKVATINMLVATVNDAPVASDVAVNTNEVTAVNAALKSSDVEGDLLTYSIVTQPRHGSLTGSGHDRAYTPAANFNGSDRITFQVSDGQSSSNIATVTFQVASINDAPVAIADNATTRATRQRALLCWQTTEMWMATTSRFRVLIARQWRSGDFRRPNHIHACSRLRWSRPVHLHNRRSWRERNRGRQGFGSQEIALNT